MGNYWWKVIKEAFFGSAESVGYSVQTFLYISLVTVLTAWFIWRPQGWAVMKENALKTLLEIVLMGVIAWLPFFLWHIAARSYLRWKTEYDRAETYKTEIEKKPRLIPVIGGTLMAPA